MCRLLVAVLTIGLLIIARSSTAQEPARLAILIGNEAYAAKVGRLKNPHNDVMLIEASLKRLGFKVTVLRDASYKTMDTALKRYVAEVRHAGPGAISFFYYSGHGVANPETQINYLIPVDVADADGDEIWFESFQQNMIIDLLSKQAAKATHYVVFDACRNELNLSGPAAKAVGAEKGFVPISDTAGLLIAYATAPKRTASDAGEGGGQYAKALADELVKPGVEAVTMFRNVQIRVKQTIGQDPWLSFPSLPAVYLAGSKPPEQIELTYWNSVKDSTSPAVLATYLERYPNGEFAPIARALIEHYEGLLKAELAAREEQRRRDDEARKAAEVKRLEEERRARELALAEESQRAKEAQKVGEARRLDEQQRAEWTARSEELRKALEEARALQQAAKAAEAQRLAAVKEAEEKTKTAEDAIAKKREADSTKDPVKVAALPKIEKRQGSGPFDGLWRLDRKSTNCAHSREWSLFFEVANDKISGSTSISKITGTVSASGQMKLSHTGTDRDRRPDGRPLSYSGNLHGGSGSGTFYKGPNCNGTFTATKM